MLRRRGSEAVHVRAHEIDGAGLQRRRALDEDGDGLVDGVLLAFVLDSVGEGNETLSDTLKIRRKMGNIH